MRRRMPADLLMADQACAEEAHAPSLVAGALPLRQDLIRSPGKTPKPNGLY